MHAYSGNRDKITSIYGCTDASMHIQLYHHCDKIKASITGLDKNCNNWSVKEGTVCSKFDILLLLAFSIIQILLTYTCNHFKQQK